ncbi:MAG: SHOCT domain-containing protein [Muribaculaceae bacterium]|nr:SHOCT domain-containing protein [Muribaculaceae bacterium]
MKSRLLLFTACIPFLTSCAYNETTDEMETTWLFWVLLAAFVIGLIAAINQGKKDEEAKRERGEKFKKATEEFNVSAKVVGVNNRYQFIVDDVDKNIIYMESTWKKKIVPFDKIMSVEMVEDNTMISSKSLGRTIGGALIGDLVAGGAGMIVGGLSGNSKLTKKVSKVEVIIKMRDFNDTALSIPCFEIGRETNNTKKEIKPDDSVYGPMYKKGLEDAIKITQLVSIIIDQMDKAPAQPAAATPAQNPSATAETTNPSSSIADEIKKLADMKAQGLITDEEFAALKSKIIK